MPLTAYDIQRLHPDHFEFLWRVILRREYGDAYRRFDGCGIDCFAGDTACQFYSHQGASWATVQAKFRDDLKAAIAAHGPNTPRFSTWAFVTTYPFKKPHEQTWLEQQKKTAPFDLVTWHEEDLLTDAERQADAERIIGLAQQAFQGGPLIVTAGLMAIGGGGAPGVQVHGGVHNVTHHGPPPMPLVGVPYAFQGQALLLAWGGDLERIQEDEPRCVEEPELALVHCTLCRYKIDPMQPVWSPPRGVAGQKTVWEVDQARGVRRKLYSVASRGYTGTFLRVRPRREPCANFCHRCGWNNSGNNCARCGSELHHVVKLERCPD